jgi:hypothetical protein
LQEGEECIKAKKIDELVDGIYKKVLVRGIAVFYQGENW